MSCSAAKKTGLAGPGLLALALSGCQALDAATPPSAPAYLVAASGRIDSSGEARSLVAERDGVITQLLIRPGDTVRRGQPLVQIACADSTAEAAAATARLTAANANRQLVDEGPRSEDRAAARARADEAQLRLDDARDLAARVVLLRPAGFVSARRVTEVESEVKALERRLAAAQAESSAIAAGARLPERAAAAAQAAALQAGVLAARDAVRRCTLRSPVDGTIVRLNRREGEFSGSSTGTVLMVVADLSRIVVRAEIPDEAAAGVRVGQRVVVWVDGNSARFPGRITELAGQMGRKSARSLDPSDRFDRDVREAIIGFDAGHPPAVIGLRVNVGVVP